MTDMTTIEAEVLARVKKSVVGWKPWGRDSDGHARLRAIIDRGETRKVVVMTITPRGLLYHQHTVVVHA